MLNYFLPFKVDPINKHCFAQVSRNLAITKNKVNPEEEGGEEVRGGTLRRQNLFSGRFLW